MSRSHTIAIIACILGVVAGCASHEVAASNAKIVELRRALYSYITGPSSEPIDTPENQARILALLKEIEPLDSAEKINITLDIFEYYDATDNDAVVCARELLVQYGNATLPYVRDRVRSAHNPDDIKNLIIDMEGS